MLFQQFVFGFHQLYGEMIWWSSVRSTCCLKKARANPARYMLDTPHTKKQMDKSVFCWHTHSIVAIILPKSVVAPLSPQRLQGVSTSKPWQKGIRMRRSSLFWVLIIPPGIPPIPTNWSCMETSMDWGFPVVSRIHLVKLAPILKTSWNKTS